MGKKRSSANIGKASVSLGHHQLEEDSAFLDYV